MNNSPVSGGELQAGKATQVVQKGGASGASDAGDTCGSASSINCLGGPGCAPADLLSFINSRSIGDTVRALGVARGTVHRLSCGYWPDDSRKIMHAWSAYKGRVGVITSSWFLRRVWAGGVVRHGGKAYTGQRLEARTGELLAVAREVSGGLLAQTLELPPERLPLVLVSAPRGLPGGAS